VNYEDDGKTNEELFIPSKMLEPGYYPAGLITLSKI
jgi:hypothetical protein